MNSHKSAIPAFLIFSLLTLIALATFLSLAGTSCIKPRDHSLLLVSILRAGEFDILTGPYSRLQFFHPGPLLFYVLRLLSWPITIFYPVSSSIYGAQFALNLLCLFSSILILLGTLGKRFALVLLCCVLLTFFRTNSEIFFDFWGPSSIVFPALLFFVACYSGAKGSLSALLLASATFSLCTQTHLGSAGSLLPVAAISLFSFLKHTKQPRIRSLLCLLILVLILWFPVLLDYFRYGSESNLLALYQFLVSEKSLLSTNEVLQYYSQYFGLPFRPFFHKEKVLLFVTIPVLSLVLSFVYNKKLFSLSALLCASTVFGFLSCYGITEGTFSYLLWFTFAPVALYLAIIADSLLRMTSYIGTQAFLLVSLVCLSSFMTYERYSLPQQNCQSQVDEGLSSFDFPNDEVLQIHLDSNSTWPLASSVALFLQQNNYAFCVERKWNYVFGPHRACENSTKSNRIIVSKKSKPKLLKSGYREIQIKRGFFYFKDSRSL
jgi:hypothetical protein